MDNKHIDYSAQRAIYELKYADEDDLFMAIGIDFDGTVVEHRYPYIGKTLPLAVETMKHWVDKYKVGYILSTMRDGQTLKDAVNWFRDNNIPLYAIQKHPTQHEWTGSPKVHCRWMLDDRNIGTPLKPDSQGIPCVDWEKVNEIFEPTLKATYKALIQHGNKGK